MQLEIVLHQLGSEALQPQVQQNGLSATLYYTKTYTTYNTYILQDTSILYYILHTIYTTYYILYYGYALESELATARRCSTLAASATRPGLPRSVFSAASRGRRPSNPAAPRPFRTSTPSKVGLQEASAVLILHHRLGQTLRERHVGCAYGRLTLAGDGLEDVQAAAAGGGDVLNQATALRDSLADRWSQFQICRNNMLLYILIYIYIII